MAQVLGVNATKAANAIGSNIVGAGQLGGRVQVMYDSYEAAAVSIDDTIKMGALLPKGAVILGMRLFYDDLGTSVTIDIGDSDDDDRYDTAIDVATAAGNTWADNIAGVGYVVGTATGDNQILLTVEGGAATGTIKLEVFYSHGG